MTTQCALFSGRGWLSFVRYVTEKLPASGKYPRGNLTMLTTYQPQAISAGKTSKPLQRMLPQYFVIKLWSRHIWSWYFFNLNKFILCSSGNLSSSCLIKGVKMQILNCQCTRVGAASFSRADSSWACCICKSIIEIKVPISLDNKSVIKFTCPEK